MKRLTVLVDVDNVLEDLTSAWVERLNKMYHTSVDASDITEWDMTKFFEGLTRDEVFSPLHDEELWKSLRPIEGSVECMKRLVRDGHDVVILTASHPDIVKMKYTCFIKKYFGFIPFRNVVFANRKQLVSGDVLIDDAPHNLEGGSYEKILFSSSHNLHLDADSSGFIRANGWKDVYDIVNRMAEEKE